MKMKFPTLVKIEHGMVLIRRGSEERLDNWYDFELSRIPTQSALLGWIHHLGGKGWFTGSHATEFIDVVSAKKGWKINMHA